MRSLKKYIDLCLRMLTQQRIRYGRIQAVKVNTRATTRWGVCKKQPDGSFVIEIASVLLDERNPEKALVETILHELLHTCEGCQNHGALWKNYAAILNRQYSLRIKGRNSAEDKGIRVETRKKNIKHKFRCERCGTIVERQRESQFTRNYRNYKCSKCGGKFQKIF